MNIAALIRALDSGERIALDLDPHLSFRAGVEAQFMHFLGNWGRRQKIREVFLHKLPEEKELAPWLVSAVVVATKLTASSRSEAELGSIKKQVNNLLRDSLFPSQDLRAGQLVLCKDFSSLAAPLALYTSTSPGGEPQVKDIDLIQKQISNWTSGEHLIEPLFPSNQQSSLESTLIPAILYELFRNTHDHARYLLHGITSPWSVRGVFIKLHDGALPELVDYADISYRHYLEGLAKTLRVGTSGNVLLLELSVFDSGPGLAQHRSSQDVKAMSLTQERNYFESCFEKHSTGVQGDVTRGLGLERVQRSLSKLKGYIRVRTGRLDLCHDFNRIPFSDRVTFYDGPSFKPQAEHETADGALFTVMVPVRSVL